MTVLAVHEDCVCMLNRKARAGKRRAHPGRELTANRKEERGIDHGAEGSA